MHKLLSTICFIGAAGLILACSLTGSSSPQIGSVSTIVAATLQALTPPAGPSQAGGGAQPEPTQSNGGAQPEATQPAPQGIPVSYNNVSFVIPVGLAASAAGESVPQVTDQNGGPWEVAPAYTRFTLQGYPLQGKFFQPQIMVYPAQAYAAANDGAQISLQRLQAILASPSGPLTNDLLPRLPFANADQMVGGAPKIVSFQNGSGVRVVTMYGQAVAPINNRDLFYHYEGLSTDGKYYIVTTLPANAPFLPATYDPSSPLPAGGIPFPDMNSTDATVFNNYFQAVTAKLTAADPAAFTPSLTALDALIQSIKVAP